MQVVTTTERRTVAAPCVDSALISAASQGELLRSVPVCVVKGEEEGLGAAYVPV